MTRKTAVIAACALAAAGGSLWAWKARSERAGRAAEGRTAAAELGPIEQTVEASGSVQPFARVEVKPPIAGRVERLLVQEGDAVKAGQIVAWMSSNDRAAILDAARAQGPEQLKRWEDAYKPTPILAPLTGVVILRNVVVGQNVEPGTVLYALADTLIAYAQVDESDIGRIHVGQKARIVLDAYPGKPVEGKVSDILFEGKNVSNVITYGVKVRPASVPDFFRSQMTANVSFEISRKPEALLIPSIAVRTRPDGVKTVSLQGPGGEPQVREVKTGIETDERVEILEGLAAGDRVLVGRGRYVPQKAPETSPLSFTGARGAGRGAGGGSGGSGGSRRRQ